MLGAEIGGEGWRALRGPAGPWLIINGGAPYEDWSGRSLWNAPTSSLTLESEKPPEVSCRRKPLALF